ncbi:hypothetical protein JXJ21_00480 [candidate division KSB1 bacterium]|nr:hypothetical protein [candidate division KSB1 bacterium]
MSEQVSKIIEQLQERIREANDEAAKIIHDAEEKSQKILNDAQAKAIEKLKATDDEIKRRFDAHEQKIQQAIRDALIDLKDKTINAMLTKTLDETVLKVMKDEKTVEQAILTMCTEFAKTQKSELKILLGPEMFEKLGKALQKKAHQMIQADVKVEKDTKIKGGFKIGPAGKGYVYDFSNEALIELFSVAYGQRIDKQIFAGE